MERIRRAGPELARWHDYLVAISRPGRPLIADPMAQPTIFPMMEDLQGPAWVHASDFPASAILERSLETIRREIEALDVERYLRYPSVILAAGSWTVMPVFVFGADAGTLMYRENP